MTQYKCWKKAGDIDTWKFSRGRRKSRRVKERGEGREQHYQGSWAEHEASRRRTEGAMERTTMQERKTGERTTRGARLPGTANKENKRQRRRRRKNNRKNRRRRTAADGKNRTGTRTKNKKSRRIRRGRIRRTGKRKKTEKEQERERAG